MGYYSVAASASEAVKDSGDVEDVDCYCDKA